MKYVPLYIKTDNSLNESLIKIPELIEFAKKNNINALTITDNTMYGVMDFYKACISNNIKPIIGLEVLYKDNKIVYYARNYNGYKNLIKLSTILTERDIELDDLEKYSSDLICLVPYTSISIYNDVRGLYDYIFKTYKNINEYNELDDNKLYMNETIYLYEEDSKYIKYLNALKSNSTIDLVSNTMFDNYIRLEVNDFELNNNNIIYDLCNIEIPFNQVLMPIYDNPDNIDSYSYLKKKCIEGIKRIFGNSIDSKYQERLKYELDIINKMGFCDYFLIVYDYIKFAKDNNIYVGPGRGSAVGSLVSYCLNITDIDPLKYDLLFERFLNPERVSMPDIDVDFEHSKRESIIKYCMERYGTKKVAPIISFSTMGSKQAIRDIARTMDLNLQVVDGLCKLLNSELSLKDNLENEKVKKYISRYDNLDKLYNIAYKFEGLKRHTSIHAAGVVMSRYDLDEIIPLDKSHTNFYTSGYDMRYLEEIGLLKMDFLAVKNLTTIHEIIDEINSKYNTNITFDNIPLNDSDTLKLFENGNTLGIFQFESDGMINLLKRLKVNTFEDLCAAIALYRPGPMKNIPTFIARKQKRERVDYIDNSLIPILKPTYGIMVYQEQIMQVAQTMADYSLGEADMLRKAMSKKKKDILLKEEKRFKERGLNKGYSKEVLDKVYDMMLKFAEYGFNKSHSVGYGVVSYRMAYLKAHYPKIFISNLLTLDNSDSNKCKKYIYECKKNNIDILLPDINYSTNKYIEEDKGIRYPLSSIKGVGSIGANYILEERNNNGLYKDIYDFVKRCYGKTINRKIIENLIYANVFSSFEYNRKTLIDNLDAIINYGELIKDLDDFALTPEIVISEEYDEKFLMEKELELYGLYLGNHPITNIKSKYQDIVSLSDIEQYFDKTINTVVYIDRLKEINTKKGDKMAFATGSDEITNIDITLFPKVYSETNIKEGDIVLVNAKVEKRFDKYQLIVNRIKKESK